jgi:hypothetical protein
VDRRATILPGERSLELRGEPKENILAASGSSGVAASSPRRGGGAAIVGVTHTSKPSFHQLAICLV